jgi:ribosome-binding protein aMBF1 (putative translation factor)
LIEIGRNTFPEDSNDGKLRNRIPQEWKHKQWERFWDAAEKINGLAKEVVSSYNQLIQQGRRKLGVE